MYVYMYAIVVCFIYFVCLYVHLICLITPKIWIIDIYLINFFYEFHHIYLAGCPDAQPARRAYAEEKALQVHVLQLDKHLGQVVLQLGRVLAQDHLARFEPCVCVLACVRGHFLQ